MLLPMLHAAQRVTDAASLDFRLLAVIIAATAALCTFALLRARDALRRPSTRRRVLVVAAAVLTVLAVVPSVFPYDHVLGDPAHAAEHARVHGSHCHDTPASCADAPVAAGPNQFLESQPLLLIPPMLALMVSALRMRRPHGQSRRPDLPPPLAAVCTV